MSNLCDQIEASLSMAVSETKQRYAFDLTLVDFTLMNFLDLSSLALRCVMNN